MGSRVVCRATESFLIEVVKSFLAEVAESYLAGELLLDDGLTGEERRDDWRESYLAGEARL